MLKTSKFVNKFDNIIAVKSINNITYVEAKTNISVYCNLDFIKIFKNFYVYSFITYFLRIVWRGKAYRVRLFKKDSKFTLNFGHSHWYKIMYSSKKYYFSRIRRQNYVVLYDNRASFLILRDIFEGIRTYNKYNRRGIRLKKSRYMRRFGKISQVNSILHSF